MRFVGVARLLIRVFSWSIFFIDLQHSDGVEMGVMVFRWDSIQGRRIAVEMRYYMNCNLGNSGRKKII